MAKSDLEIMDQMVKTNNKGIKASSTLAAMELKKKAGEITMAIDTETYHQVSKSMVLQEKKYAVVLYVIDMKEFNKIKNAK